MKNKRGYSMWEILMVVVIVVVAGFIVISIFRNLVGKEATGIRQEIELGLGDTDNDAVADRFDACLCVAGEQANDGCPYSVKPVMSNQTLRYKSCTEDFCKKIGLTACPK